MRMQALSILSTAALTAAVLVPPSFSENAPSVGENQEHIARIDCPGCLYPQVNDEGLVKWVAGVENSLVLNFTVKKASPSQLLVNGIPIYPNDGAFPPPIHAFQIENSEPSSAVLHPSSGPEPDVSKRVALELGVELAAKAQADGKTFIHFAIVGLQSAPVTGLDATEMIFTEDFEKKTLTLESIEFVPTTRAGASPTEAEKAGLEKECTTFPLLCKWKAIIAAKLAATKGAIRKGCMRFRPHHGKPKHAAAASHPHSEEKAEKIHGEHPHHDYHTDHRSVLQKGLYIASVVFMRVVIPIMLGVIAGMTGSLIGVVIGHFCVVLFRKVFRRGAQYERIEQDEQSADFECDCEKMVDSELPGYEEVAGDEPLPVEKE